MTSTEFPIEIDVESVAGLLAAEEEFLFLDCREESEYAATNIPGTVLLPMGELQDRIGELDQSRDSRVVVHCHHGGRSLRVARWLRQQGFAQAQSMAGGIDAWSERIDPNVPRY
ncbi:MAG TPA: rhodanese-like domain-containing protein [Planctomicrobium sp.]|nr:rhodanese-like domain-containing protein [Planctomicrobium sp.]